MAYRTEIELALDEMISDETGMKFQGVAVIHAQSEMAQLNACERKKDGGLDAHAEGVSQPDERKTPHVVCGSICPMAKCLCIVSLLVICFSAPSPSESPQTPATGSGFKVLLPSCTYMPNPPMTKAARDAGFDGTVVAEGTVTTRGRN